MRSGHLFLPRRHGGTVLIGQRGGDPTGLAPVVKEAGRETRPLSTFPSTGVNPVGGRASRLSPAPQRLCAQMVLVCLLMGAGLAYGQTDFSAMTFVKAAEPYTGFGYDFSGHIRKDGRMYVADKLGCSGYVSAVLQRMRLGEEWQSHRQYKHELYQWRGSRIAAHYGVELAAFLRPDQLDPETIQNLIEKKVLVANGLYLFTTTAPSGEYEGKWVTLGHTGFIRVRADGGLIQSHYSGIRPYNGLASGSFREWHGRSAYKNMPVELYLLPGAR